MKLMFAVLMLVMFLRREKNLINGLRGVVREKNKRPGAVSYQMKCHMTDSYLVYAITNVVNHFHG